MPRPTRADLLPQRSVGELCARLGLPSPPGEAARTPVTGVTLDSRSVRPGDVYAALPGANVHGADFAAAAVEAGAVAVLTDEDGVLRLRARAGGGSVPVLAVTDPRACLGSVASWVYGEPAAGLRTAGITGTNGKTTTAYLLEAALRGAGLATGLVGTVETRIGERALPSARTTPEAPDLQALLAVMREEGVQALVMEVSSHALVLGRVDGVVYDVAVFTNLSQDHLDFHHGLEDYFAAKASLFTPGHSRSAVVDVDDPFGARLAGSAGVPVTTVSTSGDTAADWVVTGRRSAADAGTTRFTLRGADGAALELTAPLPGAFNVGNTALAAVAALRLGAAADAVAAGLAACTGVPGRMERVGPSGGPLAVVDYAHTPAAVAAAVAALRPGVPGRLVVVLGAGGDRDAGKRGPMGLAAASSADVVVVTDDNPRSESPPAVRAAVVAGARSAGRAEVLEVADRREALRVAVRGLGPRDAVLVAGKGHEQGQEVAGRLLPFDDRAELRAALAAEGVLR